MTAPSGPPQAFIYDRRSTPTLGVLLARLMVCREYAAERGWELVGEWVDEDDNALTDRRPEFDRLIGKMLGAHRDGREVICLVNDFDRLSHNQEIQTRFIKRVHLAGGWVETIVGDRSDDKRGSHRRAALMKAALAGGTPRRTDHRHRCLPRRGWRRGPALPLG
ncbi:recombinase family protein [Streptomyces sp. NPDC020096]